MIRERILVYGQPGSGKSYAHLKIAEAYPKVRLHIIDTDDSIPRMLNSEFSHLSNVEVHPAYDWLSCCKALDAIKPKATSKDWLVVDMLCSAWDFVQSFFVEEIFGRDIASYFLQVRKELKQSASNLSALKGWTDWSVINKMYQTWINEITYRLPCHVLLSCKATRISHEDEPALRDMYSTFGIRPEGEKRNTYRVHSVFLLTHDRDGYYISTVKDRGRASLENAPLTSEHNFATKYLQLFADMESDDISVTK